MPNFLILDTIECNMVKMETVESAVVKFERPAFFGFSRTFDQSPSGSGNALGRAFQE